MKRKVLTICTILILLVAALPAATVGADINTQALPIPVDISHRLKDRVAPPQPYIDGVHLPSGGTTTGPQCPGGVNETVVITIPSFDPANPGNQDVVFWKESVGTSATLWVAWDYLVTHFGGEDVITCDMLAYLQGTMDSIVSTDVYYFGDYVQRPAGNANIDVMIYNIVDESFFDDTFPFYIAGFFWSSINETFDRNMIFIDSFDWANRLGDNDAPWRGNDPSLWRPLTYEGTVAHELEHLIHNDHDPDEDSWIDEGMADLAIYLNGFGHDEGHVVYYLAFHRTSLTVWGGGLENYGASYLFQLYLLENFGEKDGSSFTDWSNTWTRKLMNEQGDSIDGVENATGAAFNDLYDAWMVANYLDDPAQEGAGGFPIGYEEIDLTPFASEAFGPWSIQRAITDIYNADHHGNLPVDRYYGGAVSGTVEFPLGEVPPYAPVYGLYKGMEPEMGIFLRGDAKSGVAPHGGTYEVASGGGHLVSDRMLALNTPVGGTLTFWTWYDIEEEWDYGFVEASTDGGNTWVPLPGDITRTSNNPNSSTAWANSLIGGQTSSNTVITGNSGGWIQGTFALPAASGVLVRFSYYTDEATNGQGWFIDDITVNGFSEDFETGFDGWDLGGWAHTTGLFANDWIAGYVNPVYKKGKLQSILWSYLDGTLSGNFEIISGIVDTSRLNKKAATVFFSNRPGESPFSSGYLLLVEKGTAAP
jgi:Immune inhibitor A peptidase M6